MAIIAPFNGLLYNLQMMDDISRLVAPPYDVISEDEQEAFYQTDPYNVIRLILGKKKMGDSDWDNRYTRSADHFEKWVSEDVLIRLDKPAMFITSLTYDPGDGAGLRTRWGLICLVLIEEEGSPVILPHERTFSAHRDDRLRLMRACNAQFSQVFSLYEDSDERVMGYFQGIVNSAPDISFEFKDGTGHRMWIVHNQSIFRSVADGMRNKRIFIADGHHRYETARNYRNIMRARYGTRPLGRSYEFLMMYLTNMNDVGLTILPSHRLIRRCAGFELEPFLNEINRWFEITVAPLSGDDPAKDCAGLKDCLDEKGQRSPTIGFHYHEDHRYFLFTLKQGMENEMGDDLHPSQRKLDVLVLSRLILQKTLGFRREDLDDEKKFHYQSDMVRTVSSVDSGAYQMAFLLNPTKMDHVKEVAGNALIMPRKSTYFYPKILTGLVFNKIDPHEIIQTPNR
jgi:uncharacterized protein (DUF1015 family)